MHTISARKARGTAAASARAALELPWLPESCLFTTFPLEESFAVPMDFLFRRKAARTVTPPITQKTGHAWERMSAAEIPAAAADMAGAPCITTS